MFSDLLDHLGSRVGVLPLESVTGCSFIRCVACRFLGFGENDSFYYDRNVEVPGCDVFVAGKFIWPGGLDCVGWLVSDGRRYTCVERVQVPRYLFGGCYVFRVLGVCAFLPGWGEIEGLL